MKKPENKITITNIDSGESIEIEVEPHVVGSTYVRTVLDMVEDKRRMEFLYGMFYPKITDKIFALGPPLLDVEYDGCLSTCVPVDMNVEYDGHNKNKVFVEIKFQVVRPAE